MVVSNDGRTVTRRLVVVPTAIGIGSILDALSEDEVAASTEDLLAGLLEQDAKRQERRLVHDSLGRARVGGGLAAKVLGAVEGARVAVDGFEQVALWEDALAGPGQVSLVRIVNVVFEVAFWCALSSE